MGVRKCSECGKKGHNSRTCKGLKTRNVYGFVKLFGVHIPYTNGPCSDHDKGFGPMTRKKCHSMPSLFGDSDYESSDYKLTNGSLSDGLISRTPARNRKKGVAWSEEEHRQFLLGLHKLGKGDWKGISMNFVTTRSPTQIASHAQKYFLRQQNNCYNYINTKHKKHQPHWPSLFHVVGRSETRVDHQVVEPSKLSGDRILIKTSDLGKKLDCNIFALRKKSADTRRLRSDHHKNLKKMPESEMGARMIAERTLIHLAWNSPLLLHTHAAFLDNFSLLSEKKHRYI